MSDHTYFWHDYETFGRVPKRDRPAQFAGVRTDADLNEVEAPVMIYCRPAPDSLPEPEACLLTGITPQLCLERGVPEHEFARTIEHELARPGTIGVGYNSIRFDDEVTRHLLWRCLYDPYAREWQNECGRWDLLDVVRCCYALRPEGIDWPLHDDGRPSFKLEHLATVNGLMHASAHDALSDVRATIALARLIKNTKPALWEFCLRLRSKDAVRGEINAAQQRGQPFLHVSGMYGPERGCLAAVWPLAPHPANKNELIVWDLSHDPGALFDLGIDELRLRMFSKQDQLPPGVTRLPIKTIHLNKSPIVVSNLKTLSDEMAARWALDLPLVMRHAAVAAKASAAISALWPEVYQRSPKEFAVDVDEDLYGGLVGNDDRRLLDRLRALSPDQLALKRPDFKDARLSELLLRYRARNHPDTLSPAEHAQWLEHCARRLHDGGDGRLGLQAYLDHIDVLIEDADERGQDILGALVDHAAEIAPELP